MLTRVEVIHSFAERYRVLLEFVGDGVTIRQLDSIIIAADNAMATLLGHTVEELKGTNIARFL